jgi:hypothetical protein
MKVSAKIGTANLAMFLSFARRLIIRFQSFALTTLQATCKGKASRLIIGLQLHRTERRLMSILRTFCLTVKAEHEWTVPARVVSLFLAH